MGEETREERERREHSKLWGEVDKIRDRLHQWAISIGAVQIVREKVDKLADSFEAHKDEDGEQHRKLAVVESDVSGLKEIERNRLTRIGVMVGIITGAIQVLGWLLMKATVAAQPVAEQLGK